MFRFFLLLLLPVPLFAQNVFERQKLDHQAVYTTAISKFIQNHEDAITNTKEGKILFVKNGDFLSEFKDSSTGVRVKLLDPATEADTLSHYLNKKQKLTIADVQQMLMREYNSYIWIMPTKVTFNAHRKTVSAPSYTNMLCEYTYDYTQKRDSYWYFKDASCKDLD